VALPNLRDVIRQLLLCTATALAVTVTGCGAQAKPTTTTTIPAGTSSHQLRTPDGQQRTFGVHRPAVEPGAKGYPLVLMLHGGFGTGAQAEAAYGWDELAERQGFVVVYPDGLDRAWNAGSCCGAPQRDGIDDVAFIAALVAQVDEIVSIDASRRYVTGMSNGAMMAYRLACETTLFAAVAPVAGTQLVSCTDGQPTSVLHLHGTSDTRVHLDGTTGDGVAKVTGPPIAKVLAGWRQRDHCAAFATTTAGAVTTSIADCPLGRTVEWILIDGMGHEWPGGARSATQLEATAVIWDFFQRHPRAAS